MISYQRMKNTVFEWVTKEHLSAELVVDGERQSDLWMANLPCNEAWVRTPIPDSPLGPCLQDSNLAYSVPACRGKRWYSTEVAVLLRGVTQVFCHAFTFFFCCGHEVVVSDSTSELPLLPSQIWVITVVTAHQTLSSAGTANAVLYGCMVVFSLRVCLLGECGRSCCWTLAVLEGFWMKKKHFFFSPGKRYEVEASYLTTVNWKHTCPLSHS